MPKKTALSASQEQTLHARRRRLQRHADKHPEIKNLLAEHESLTVRVIELEEVEKLYTEASTPKQKQAEKARAKDAEVKATSEQLKVAEDVAANLRKDIQAANADIARLEALADETGEKAKVLSEQLEQTEADLKAAQEVDVEGMQAELEAAASELEELRKLRNAKALFEENKKLRKENADLKSKIEAAGSPAPDSPDEESEEIESE